MCRNVTIKSSAIIINSLLAILVCFSPAWSEEPTQAISATGEGKAALVLKPAVANGSAAKAMMLGSARAGKRIVAVGEHGIVLLSDDDGKSFRQAKSVPVRSTLTSVSFIDDKAGWSVGHWGVILATTDGGESWQIQRSDTSVDQPLFSVLFKNRNRGFAVGLWSLILETSDGGKTWNKFKLPPPPGGGKTDRNLLAIFAGKSGSIFIVAEQGTIIKSTDDGTTWKYSVTGYKGSFWSGITLQNGSILVGGLRGALYRSADDGGTWKEVNSGTKSSITSFAETGNKVYGAGLDGVWLESSNSGTTFSANQRDDKVPFTALMAGTSGQVIAFTKSGILTGLKEEKK